MEAEELQMARITWKAGGKDLIKGVKPPVKGVSGLSARVQSEKEGRERERGCSQACQVLLQLMVEPGQQVEHWVHACMCTQLM